MKKAQTSSAEVWAKRWLDSVAGGASMSQRKVKSVLKHGGDLQAVRKLAIQRGVHLVRLTDDNGIELVAASTKPFTIIC